ncbi:hypothetical protein RI129_006039 [Pyrocoelia pectoralis]|uniref:Uncharacterized protein n=1 Tax=Pyrocoelia pectoralis TaxID=417401 RepID=A0AAN7VEK9_9COLE
MKLFAILIGFVSVQCVFSEPCGKPVKNSTDDCMKIIHPLHKLLGDVPNLPGQCLEQITDLLKKLRVDINNGLSTTTHSECLKMALQHVDDLSQSYMAKIISVDGSIKQRFIGVYLDLGNAIVGAQECVNKPISSCKQIKECCTNVRNKLYASKNSSIEKVSDFLVAFASEFGKTCHSIFDSIRNIERDVATC